LTASWLVVENSLEVGVYWIQHIHGIDYDIDKMKTTTRVRIKSIKGRDIVSESSILPNQGISQYRV
jgi:hypothetical protein